MRLFGSAPYRDPWLGSFERKWGRFRGTIALGGEAVALILPGGRKAPDARCLELARRLLTRFDEVRTKIGQSLFEHYETYRDAYETGHLPGCGSLCSIADADGVWAGVETERVFIAPLRGAPGDEPVIEIAYRTAWDEEHTLGARIQHWELLELCGSV